MFSTLHVSVQKVTVVVSVSVSVSVLERKYYRGGGLAARISPRI